MRCILLTACGIALVVAAFAQGDADYQKWMKTVGATSASLRKNLDSKNAESASADAKKLQDAFEQVHVYWQKKNINDAMKFAMDAGTGFREIGEQATAGKFEDAAATLKKAMTTCGGCHTAHREKAEDGSWKIK
jgi:hypothetical protein